MMKESCLTIADTSNLMECTDGSIIYWNTIPEIDQNGVTFVADLIQSTPSLVKDEFLKWLSGLGSQSLRGSDLAKHLTIEEDCSFWWLMAISQADNIGKSSWINDALKIISIKNFFESNQFYSIHLISNDTRLIQCFKKLAKIWGVDFSFNATAKTKISLFFVERFSTSVYLILARIRGAVWVMHYAMTRWRLKDLGTHELKEFSANFLFISFLENLDLELLSKGLFRSGYWGGLPIQIEASNKSSIWLHQFPFENASISSKNLKETLINSNINVKKNVRHLVFENFLSLSVIFQAFKTYLFLQRRLNEVKPLVEASDVGGLNFWALFQKEWIFESSGRPAIQNLLNFFMIKRLIALLSPQAKVVYLQENQSHEYSFIQLCNKGHQTFGVPHSSIRFWDLRYATIGKERVLKGSKRPSPTKVIANGEHAFNVFVNGGKNPESIEKATALRYTSLMKRLSDCQKQSIEIKNLFERVLLLGDYDAQANRRLLSVVQGMASDVTQSTIILKEHPATPISTNEYPEIEFQTATSSLLELIEWSTIVVSGETTTAALEGYLFGRPTIVVVEGRSIIKSPLLGLKGPKFVKSSAELSNILSGDFKIETLETTDNFFYYSSNLDDWRSILNI